MEDHERLAIFAEFLGLPIRQFRELAINRGLVSRSTLDRIRGGNRQDRDHKKQRSFAKLVKFIDPDYLARPDQPDDPFVQSEVARRLRALDWSALVLWDAFLKGDTDVPPTWDSIEEHWLMTCAHVPRAPKDETIEAQLAHVKKLVDELEQLGTTHGIIHGGRSPNDLVRWSWVGARLDHNTWLRMRAAYYRAQILIEHTADMIYLGTPVLSFSISPSKVWQRRVGPAGHAGEELLEAYSGRWVRLQNALVHGRQSAVVMFSEQRTKEFFETLQPEERAATAQHIEDLAKGGLTLLMTTLTESEERDLCVSITLGGERPGLATADQLTVATKPERSAIVTLAQSREYKERRALFEDIWNSPRTCRIQASDLRDLVPKERVARRTR